MRGNSFNGGAERQYSAGWTAVLIRNIGGAERARDSPSNSRSLQVGMWPCKSVHERAIPNTMSGRNGRTILVFDISHSIRSKP